jgi:GT2 family glycosyltransferase
MPNVSIIIPVMNQLPFTRNCLDALYRRTQRRLYELIIVDNGSTDGTQDYMNLQTHPLRYLRNETNLGFAQACTIGAEAARCEWVLFLHNDTLPQQGWLEALIDLAASDSQIGAVGARLLWPNGMLQESGGIVFSDASTCHIGNRDDPSKDLYNKVYEVDFCSSSCLLVRRNVFLNLKGFDTQYFPHYYECEDLCFTLRSHNYRVMYCPDSLVIHYEGMTPLENNVHREQLMEQHRKKFAAKWRDELRLQPMPPVESGLMVVESRQGIKLRVGKWYYIGNDRVLKQNLERFTRFHLTNPKTRLALYGAGKHTHRLLAQEIIPKKQMAAIFDDLSTLRDIQGIPIMKPQQASQVAFDLLLISSDSIWEDLAFKARRWAPAGCPIESLYADI